MDRQATEELLAGLGFEAPSQSFEVLRRLVDPATRLGKVLAHVFPVMAPALALASNPDQALVRLERVAEAVGDRHGPADTLAADPSAAQRLAHVVAASSFATDLLVADPGADRRRSPTAGARSTRRPRSSPPSADTRPASSSRARPASAIADVADRAVREAVEAAEPDLPFAVIGMGKLGARELNFASDLDLLFVYEGEGADDMRRAVDAAERVMRAIRDAGWEPDADLRPEGRSGPLARSLAGYLEYWERYAELWEFQALLRARHVAGDEQLGRRFVLNAADFAYPPDGITVDRVGEIRRMRERIERERVEAARGGEVPLQARLRVARRRAVRGGGVADALRRRASGASHEPYARGDRAPGGASICGAERRARPGRGVRVPLGREERARGRSPVARRGGAGVPEEQTALARRLGYEEYPRQSFIDDYLRVTRRARRAMERVFHEEA